MTDHAPRPHLVLASASPARLATLRRAGIEPEVIVSNVDEDGVDGGSPPATAQLLAGMKAAAVAELLPGAPAGTLVLGCDSLLEFDAAALGKPTSPEAAITRWRAMRGRSGVLHTGHAVIEPATGRRAERTASTIVHFADLTDAEIDAYVAAGEPLWVAGAFTIDGLGGAFVERIEGCHHNVVGVSLPLLRRLVGDFGVAWHELWSEGPNNHEQ
ncbi:MAG: Maf family protein [Sporichthyaceae bacterium]